MTSRFERGYGSEERVKWVKSQRCYVTGQAGTKLDPIVNSHVKTRGAGGGPEYIVPMLLSLEKELHNIGIESFQLKHGVNLWQLAKLCEARWVNRG